MTFSRRCKFSLSGCVFVNTPCILSVEIVTNVIIQKHNCIALHSKSWYCVRERGSIFLSNKNLSIMTPMAWALITAIIRAKYVFTLMCGAALKIVKHTKHIYLHIELKARTFVFHSVRMCVSAHPHSLALSLSLFLSFSLYLSLGLLHLAFGVTSVASADIACVLSYRCIY